MSQLEPEDPQHAGQPQDGAADSDSPGAAGPGAAGPDAAGRDAAGPDAAGPDAAGPDAAPTATSPARAALDELDGLADKPVAEHPGVYQRVHAQLQDALSDIDDT